MAQYVGLDVADEETSLCVINQEGAVLAEARVASKPAAIAAFISAPAPQAAKVGFETGTARGLALAEFKDGSNAVQVDQLIAQSAAVQDAHLSHLRANEIEAAEKARAANERVGRESGRRAQGAGADRARAVRPPSHEPAHPVRSS